MLRNSGGLRLLRGGLGVQVVADNHTIDDSLAALACAATKKAQHGKARSVYKGTQAVQEDGF